MKKHLVLVLAMLALFIACEQPTDPENIPPHTHSYGAAWHSDASQHWHECACGEKSGTAAHTPPDGVCTVCGYDNTHIHDFDGAWHHNATEHWKECPTDNAQGAIDNHTFVDGVCSECQYDQNHTHDLVKINEVAATCETTGNIEHWTCSICDNHFDDEHGTTELTAEDIVLTKLPHDFTKTDAQAATCEDEGNIEYWTCSVCGELFADEEGEDALTTADIMSPALGHSLSKTKDAVAPTCTEAGNPDYWTCSVCGKFFADENGATALTAEDIVIVATGHNHSGGWETDPTHHWHECACGDKADYALHSPADGVCDECGYDNTVHSGPDLTNWTAVPGISTPVDDIIYAEDKGIFVAVGYSKAGPNMIYGYRSKDGINWDTSSVSNDSAGYTFGNLVYGNGVFVTCGYRGSGGTSVWYSEDGLNWVLGYEHGSDTFYPISFRDGTFVGYYSAGGTMISSANGKDWPDENESETETDPIGFSLKSISYGGGTFVASEQYGSRIAYSINGATWQEATSPFTGGERIQSITYADGKFIAVAIKTTYPIGPVMTAYSFDGITWTPSDVLIDLGADTAIAITIGGNVSYGSGIFVALYTGSIMFPLPTYYYRIMFSPDGTNWETITHNINSTITGLAFGADRFVAVGENAILYTAIEE